MQRAAHRGQQPHRRTRVIADDGRARLAAELRVEAIGDVAQFVALPVRQGGQAGFATLLGPVPLPPDERADRQPRRDDQQRTTEERRPRQPRPHPDDTRRERPHEGPGPRDDAARHRGAQEPRQQHGNRRPLQQRPLQPRPHERDDDRDDRRNRQRRRARHRELRRARQVRARQQRRNRRPRERIGLRAGPPAGRATGLCAGLAAGCATGLCAGLGLVLRHWDSSVVVGAAGCAAGCAPGIRETAGLPWGGRGGGSSARRKAPACDIGCFLDTSTARHRAAWPPG